EAPALCAAEQRREEAQVRSRARAQIEDLERRLGRASRELAAQHRDERQRARRRIERLAQSEPVGREAAHARAPTPSSAAANFAAASCQVGSESRAARARSANAARRAGSSSRLASAFASARLSPGGTSKLAAAGTVSGIAPAVVLTTGKPCVTASASAMP